MTSAGHFWKLPFTPPWLLVAAVALALLGWLLPSARRVPERRLRGAAIFLGITAATFFARHLLLTPGFFHQHGQGPVWARYGIIHPSSCQYGPGFHDLYSFIGSYGRIDPERLLFPAQALLGALIPAFTFVLARRAGARLPVALAAAFAVAVDPIFARIAESESYYDTCAFLLFFAASALACGASRASLRSPRFHLCALAAGLLVAQAARVHPVAWAPAALLPLVVILIRGRLLDRIALAACAAVIIAACVGLFAGPAIKFVLAGRMGDTWGPSLTVSPLRRVLGPLAILAVTGAAAVVLPRSRDLLLRAGAALFALSFAQAANVMASMEPPWIFGAYARLYAPVLLCALAALAAQLLPPNGQRRVAFVLACAALLHTAIRGPWLMRSTVDAREARWVLDLRRTLLPGTTGLAYLGQTSTGNVFLPMFTNFPFHAGDRAFLPPGVRVPYYLRSSLCSTEEGRPTCDAFERAHPDMTPVAEQRFSTIPEDEVPYFENPVRVILYRLPDPR